MRRSVVLCAFVIAAAVAPAAAQEPLPPGAFGSLGMYPKRLTCADLPAYSEPRPTHRIPSAHEPDAKLRRAFSQPDTLVIPGGTRVGLQTGQQFFVRRVIPNVQRSKPMPWAPATIHTAGWITVTTVDDFSALARIDHACDGFLAGDYLEPFTPSPLPAGTPGVGSSRGPRVVPPTRLRNLRLLERVEIDRHRLLARFHLIGRQPLGALQPCNDFHAVDISPPSNVVPRVIVLLAHQRFVDRRPRARRDGGARLWPQHRRRRYARPTPPADARRRSTGVRIARPASRPTAPRGSAETTRSASARTARRRSLEHAGPSSCTMIRGRSME